jgi:hypothetical protein
MSVEHTVKQIHHICLTVPLGIIAGCGIGLKKFQIPCTVVYFTTSCLQIFHATTNNICVGDPHQCAVSSVG